MHIVHCFWPRRCALLLGGSSSCVMCKTPCAPITCWLGHDLRCTHGLLLSALCSNDELLEEEAQATAVAAAKSKAVAAATAAAEAALRPRLEPSAGSAAVADGGVLALHCHLQHVKTHQQRQVGGTLNALPADTHQLWQRICSCGTVVITEYSLADLSAGAASGIALTKCHTLFCEQLVACYRAAAQAAKPLARLLGCRFYLMGRPLRRCLGGRMQVVALCPLGTLCRYASCCMHCPGRPSLFSPTDCAIGSLFAS